MEVVGPYISLILFTFMRLTGHCHHFALEGRHTTRPRLYSNATQRSYLGSLATTHRLSSISCIFCPSTFNVHLSRCPSNPPPLYHIRRPTLQVRASQTQVMRLVPDTPKSLSDSPLEHSGVGRLGWIGRNGSRTPVHFFNLTCSLSLDFSLFLPSQWELNDTALSSTLRLLSRLTPKYHTFPIPFKTISLSPYDAAWTVAGRTFAL